MTKLAESLGLAVAVLSRHCNKTAETACL